MNNVEPCVTSPELSECTAARETGVIQAVAAAIKSPRIPFTLLLPARAHARAVTMLADTRGEAATMPWLRGLGLVAVVVMAATASAGPVQAGPRLTPGTQVHAESGSCTAGFAAQGNDGRYYLMTSGHCDAHDGSVWTYGNDVPLGRITASDDEGTKDAALILLDPGVGAPAGDVGGRYSVRDVLRPSQIKVGMPFCKFGAFSGETCGTVTGFEGDVVEASVYCLNGDSGSPGFVKNADGTVSAVGLLSSAPEGDDNTAYFALVNPLLVTWGLHILP